MDLGLSDRVYIVTGAASRLGRACARQLAGEGARLVLGGGDEDALRATAAALGGPEHALPIPGDLAEAGLETCLVAAAIARYGRLDGALVGVQTPAPGTVLDTEDGVWRLGFESVFLGPVRLCRAVASGVSTEGGSIVLMLSTSAREPLPQRALAGGLEPGLAMTVKLLADEAGAGNVRVNAVLPGLLECETAAAERSEAPVALRRRGEPLEFARPAVFLLSPAASYVTGTTLTVDGGRTRSP